LNTLILDRDGVINHDSADFIKSAEEFIPLPGSIEAIAQASMAGWRVVVATNQSGLGRGLFDSYALAQMHGKLSDLVEEAGGKVEGIFYCPHKPDEGCDCRKPRVGLLREAAKVFGEDFQGAPFVGDSLRDLKAAVAFGCQPVLVKTGKGEATQSRLSQDPSLLGGIEPPIFDDLASAVRALLA
jgi:D-glycero-D-manno-heptose 1,7-bisphosphate phosphatase